MHCYSQFMIQENNCLPDNNLLCSCVSNSGKPTLDGTIIDSLKFRGKYMIKLLYFINQRSNEGF
ncbi:hypothetical protein DASC09_014820 [Saccharomycopsis crataegensis]|uniref:Uncharacterized protein n=1 Tax=Saccharomycopsis crataegensis TaxID=43959 RepID=A0AAV5QHT9_9ASCO|nr:hypothetical protein DASC09_014820 [Saccharomycopsis crataegensis]